MSTKTLTTIPLVQGHYSRNEALDLITELIHVKIRFLENKIRSSENEEDIKMREQRIKQLQKSLFEVRRDLEDKNKSVSLHSSIDIE